MREGYYTKYEITNHTYWVFLAGMFLGYIICYGRYVLQWPI